MEVGGNTFVKILGETPGGKMGHEFFRGLTLTVEIKKGKSLVKKSIHTTTPPKGIMERGESFSRKKSRRRGGGMGGGNRVTKVKNAWGGESKNLSAQSPEATKPKGGSTIEGKKKIVVEAMRWSTQGRNWDVGNVR